MFGVEGSAAYTQKPYKNKNQSPRKTPRKKCTDGPGSTQ
jgi:hypothetical protein